MYITFSNQHAFLVLPSQSSLTTPLFSHSKRTKMSSALQEIILTSSPDGPIVAYDISTGSPLAHFNGSRSPRKGLALVGKKLIAASHVSSDTGLGSIHLYNWWSSFAFHDLPMPEPVAPLVATQDGMFLFAGGVSGYLYSISLPSGDIVQSLAMHNKAITCLEINDDGSLIFSGSDDGTVAVLAVHQLVYNPLSCWSDGATEYSALLQRFIGHESSITAITAGIGGCNGTIISCSLDCTCKFWSLMYNTPLYTITFPCTIWGAAMDPPESELYIAGSDGLVYKSALKLTSKHSLAQGMEIKTWKKQPGGGPITAIGTINWGQNLVTASEEGKVCIWDMNKSQLIKVLEQKQMGGSISHLLIAKGLKDSIPPVARLRESTNEEWDFSGKEICRPIKELMEMEEKLEVGVKGRRRAICTLELAIGAYEKLLNLILKEAKSGSNDY